MKVTYILLSLVLAVSFTTCSSDSEQGTTTIKIIFQDVSDKGKIITGNTTYLSDEIPTGVHHIDVSVYAKSTASASNLIYLNTFAKDVREATISVTSGPDRILVLEGKTMANTTLYRGESAPTDLEPDTTVSIPVSMRAIPVNYATVNVTLIDDNDVSDDNAIFNFDESEGSDVLNYQIMLSIFTPAHELFNVENPEDIEITCDVTGDFRDIDLTESVTPGIEVPANTYVILVARGYSSSRPGDFSIVGLSVITGDALSTNATADVNLFLNSCDLTKPIYSDLTDDEIQDLDSDADNWADICECND